MFINQYCNLQVDAFVKCISANNNQKEKCNYEHKQLVMCLSSINFNHDHLKINMANNCTYMHNPSLHKQRIS